MRSVRLCVLASGSGGNSVWVDSGAARILIDADHAHAAGILGRKLSVRVHATRGTLRELRDPPPDELRCAVRGGVPVRLSGLTVTPVALPHDASEPVAYVVDDGVSRAAVLTDLGSVTAGIVRALQDLDALVLEMN